VPVAAGPRFSFVRRLLAGNSHSKKMKMGAILAALHLIGFI
jgi:hypothetical protein